MILIFLVGVGRPQVCRGHLFDRGSNHTKGWHVVAVHVRMSRAHALRPWKATTGQV